jgi:hypothetical protein
MVLLLQQKEQQHRTPPKRIHTRLRMQKQQEKSILVPPNGGITISELINNKIKYSGQVVRVQGQVVKLNNGIMKRNWIHIKDASINSENKDLTVTTTESVALGDIVSFEGKIAVDKDFGSGYSYEIIMEEAKIIK